MINRLGQIAIDVCEAWKDAEDGIGELVLTFNDAWAWIKLRIKFVERIGRGLKKEHILALDSLCLMLAQKLSTAATNIKKVKPPSPDELEGQRARFWDHYFHSDWDKPAYIGLKSNLRSLIQEIEDWQRLFDPCWYLLIRDSRPSVDRDWTHGVREEETVMRGRGSKSAPFSSMQTLRASLRAGSDRQANIWMPAIQPETVPILYSNAVVAHSSDRNGVSYIIDSVYCPPGNNISIIHRDVRRLANNLKHADPDVFGLLNCQGVMKVKDTVNNTVKSFDLVFNKPEGLGAPQSLRQSLLSSNGIASLNRRLRIAKELVRSISHVHTFKLVHKNVRPESVLLFEDAASSRCLTGLVGFVGTRCADGPSAMLGDLQWHKNLYRHPSRQGEDAVDSYMIQHDIYSLGVCLLEVGLWESFVSYTDQLDPEPGLGLDPMRAWLVDNGYGERACASHLKMFLTETARKRLPLVMGERYTDIVTTCLTFLDKDEDGIGNDDGLDDGDGILVGLWFVEKILLKINEIII